MAKQTEYGILVEPLADADGGGWLPSVPALPVLAEAVGKRSA